MSLYLKYRPHDFDNLEGQDFIKTTLKQAIKDNKTVWAYLFCWPRWTWKTSTARIFAKTINCENSKEWNPCLTCWICTDFLDDRLIDIIEIDAASHTWVDNIRDIIEKAQFSPTRTKYKVYIVDEVHMLSKWAFNALLKILEEPPKHVKFILATTEVDKVPETILSRCQRYDFKQGTPENIKNRLTYIAKHENIHIDQQSLDYIIRNSRWWFRNAISLFEQLIVDSKIDFETIVKTLWLTNTDLIENFLNKLISKDKSIVDDFENILESWKNIKLFFKDLIFFARDLMIKKLKQWENINNLIDIVDKLSDTYSKTKNSLDENTVFLVWIVKIVSSYIQPQNNTIHTEEKIETKQVFYTTPEVKVEKITQTQETSFKATQNNTPNDDLLSDASDIFGWWEEEIESFPKTTSENTTSTSFNKDTLVAELKKIWAKAATTMSLRWADFLINWNSLTIKFKTNFALKTINNNESITLIQEGLKNIWREDLKIELR